MELKNRKPRLNGRQRQFIRILCDENLSPEDLYRRCNLKGSEFLEWLERKPFKRALGRIDRLIERQYDFELSVGARTAIRGLIGQTTSGDPHEKRLARVNLAGLFKEFRDRRARKVLTRKAATASARQEFPPDLDPAEAERLLRELQEGAPSSPEEPECN